MALSQDDRISISGKVIDIPKKIADATSTKSLIDKELAKAQADDNANKTLSDNFTALINQYQIEASRYDSFLKTEIVEQDFIDSAKRKVGNFFFQNQPLVPTPSLPAGVWVNFVPSSANIAIGKTYLETHLSTQKEQALIDTINAKITIIESYSNPTRSTGMSCNSGSGTCSLPSYVTQPTCVGALPTPGVWTVGPDVISNDSAFQAASTDLINAVLAWQTFYNTTKAIINAITDSNSTRASGNITASNAIASTNSIVSSWQSLPTFDTNHGTTTCAAFNSLNVNLLLETKYRADGLLILKNSLPIRVTDISTRLSSINSSYLGAISQSSDGTIVTATALYGSRFRIIDLRLNIMTGTLSKVLAIGSGKNAQDQAINSFNNADAAYADVVKASVFTAPSIGTNKIHIKDASMFAVSDSVYVVANGQQEISCTISGITGNLVELSTSIPMKYRETEGARLYKLV